MNVREILEGTRYINVRYFMCISQRTNERIARPHRDDWWGGEGGLRSSPFIAHPFRSDFETNSR